jgi:hypothetical protein
VLVVVLWIVLLVAGSAALLARAVSVNARASAALARTAMAEAAADGVIRLTAYRLVKGSAGGGAAPLPEDGSWFACGMATNETARVSVQDQGGLIDLNQAPLAVLRPLLILALGADDGRRAVEALSERRGRAVDQADSGDEPGIDGSFRTPDELLGPLDLPPATMAGVAAWLTTESRSDGIDPTVAPAALRDLMTNLGSAGHAIPPQIVRRSRRRVFAITADVGQAATGRRARRALIEFARSPDRLFRVLRWATIDASIDAGTAPASPGAARTGASC